MLGYIGLCYVGLIHSREILVFVRTLRSMLRYFGLANQQGSMMTVRDKSGD